MLDPWVVGVLVNLAGNICINIGTNCVKYDHGRSRLQHHTSSMGSNSSVMSGEQLLDNAPNSAMAANLQGSFCSRLFTPVTSCWSRFIRHGRWWYVGWSFFTIGNIGNFVSFSFASQSLLAGLGSSQFLMNCICEWYFNDQRITSRMLKATLMIIIGNTLIVAFASHASLILTVDVIFQLLFETVFDVYIVILLFLCLLMQIYYNETRKKLRAYQAAILSFMEQGGNVQINLSNGAGEHALGVGINSSPSANLNHPVHNQLLPPLPTPLSAWRLKMLPFSYAAVSAIIGTQSVLLAKATSDLLRTSVTGDQQFTQGFTWVILVGWASTIVFWLYRMDTALRKFDGPFIVPVLQVVWTLFSIIGGGIFYKEFNKMTSLAIGLFTLGVAVMMSGVYLLAPQPHPSHSGGGGGGQGGVEMQQVHQMRIAAQQMADMEAGLHSGNSPYDNGMRKESTGSGNSSGNSLGQISVSPIYGGHGKDDKPMASLSIPPTKVTRVTSTGRMVIQSDDRPLSRGDVYVEMSPEFGSYKSAIDQPVRQAVSASTTAKMTSSSSNPNNAGRLKGGPGSRYQSNAESQSESLISPSSPTADNEDPASQADEKTRSSSVDEMILPMQLQSASSSSSSSYAAAMEKPGLKSGGSTPMPPHHASNATTHHNQHPYAAHPPKRTLRPYHSSSDAHPSHPPLARGILGEAGLLDGVGVTTTPPMRPAVHWGTPDRPATSESLRDYSRPTSASGSHMLHHHSNESGANSIPPSPALTGFDPNHYGGATKRSRAFSLGFSIPMVELGESP